MSSGPLSVKIYTTNGTTLQNLSFYVAPIFQLFPARTLTMTSSASSTHHKLTLIEIWKTYQSRIPPGQRSNFTDRYLFGTSQQSLASTTQGESPTTVLNKYVSTNGKTICKNLPQVLYEHRSQTFMKKGD